MTATDPINHHSLPSALKELVERYHRNELPLDRFDEAFLAIAANEQALSYLEFLEGRRSDWLTRETTPPAIEPIAPPPRLLEPIIDFRPVPRGAQAKTKAPTESPAVATPLPERTEVVDGNSLVAQILTTSASWPSEVAATIAVETPVAAFPPPLPIELAPIVAEAQVPLGLATFQESPPGVAWRLIGCVLLLALVGLVFITQPSSDAASRRPARPLSSPGMIAN